MTTVCSIHDLSTYRAKKEFEKLSEMISSIVSDRSSHPFRVDTIKQAILRTHKAA